MTLKRIVIPLAIVAMCHGWSPAGAADYRSPEAIADAVASLSRSHGGQTEVLELARTPGDRPVELLILGSGDEKPALLVVANMEGNSPQASEAAVRLAELLLTDWQDELVAYRWYIIPVGNPDGYARYFDSPRELRSTNDRPVNDDLDDATDEDGPDDLNGDGVITMMRQEHPEGNWLPVEGNPVLMKEADRGKGETGRYRLIEEGIDNDSDGRINEDGPGGSNPGRNFPHSFKHYTTTDGLWAASEVETRAVLRWAFDHPEIAMVITLGRSNSLRTVPEGGKVVATQKSYKLPKGIAKQMGADPNERFPLSELVQMGRDWTGMQDLTEEMVLQFLGVGAATSPDKKDIPYWKEITERYKKFTEEQGLDEERLDSPKSKSGCVEDWAYYQYGTPSFSLDFWTPPEKEAEAKAGEDDELTPDKIEKMSNDEFIALGEEKIQAFLDANDAPPQYNAQMVIGAVQGGMMSPEKIAEFMRERQEKEESGGADPKDLALYDAQPDAFVVWEAYEHPTLGPVEIGGMKPYADRVAPADLSDSLIDGHLPFLQQLVAMLPRLSLGRVQIEKRGSDSWKVEVWAVNEGFLPYPTYQGKRCKRPAPAVIEVDAGSAVLVEGRARSPLDVVPGSGGTQKVTWLIQGSEGREVTLLLSSPSAGTARKQIVLREGTQ